MNFEINVVKIGGGEGNAIEPLVDELAEHWQTGERWILVHGGSARVNEVATNLGHPPQFVQSPSGFTSRRTDRKTAGIFAMVCAGDVNTSIVRQLQAQGVNAVGLSGLDGRLLSGPRKKAIRVQENGRQRILRDDYTGKVTQVNAELLRMLLTNDYLPVVSPPAISDEYEIINVDGDRAAAAIAGEIHASRLVLLTGAPGVLEDPEDPTSLITDIELDEIDRVMQDNAEGRMRIKLLAAGEALDDGVEQVYIGASAVTEPLNAVLNGNGTRISRLVSADESGELIQEGRA